MIFARFCYAWAQYVIGVSYAVVNGNEQSYSKAIKWFRRSAERGNPHAQYNLGIMGSAGTVLIDHFPNHSHPRLHFLGVGDDYRYVL